MSKLMWKEICEEYLHMAKTVEKKELMIMIFLLPTIRAQT